MMIHVVSINEISQIADMFIEFMFELKAVSRDNYFDFNVIVKEDIVEFLMDFLNCDTGIIYYSIDNENNITGFIIGLEKDCFLPLSQTKKIGYIEALYVKKEFRQKGVARELEEKLLNYFRGRELKYIELSLLTNNYTAKSFWQQRDYSIFREQCRKQL